MCIVVGHKESDSFYVCFVLLLKITKWIHVGFWFCLVNCEAIEWTWAGLTDRRMWNAASMKHACKICSLCGWILLQLFFFFFSLTNTKKRTQILPDEMIAPEESATIHSRARASKHSIYNCAINNCELANDNSFFLLRQFQYLDCFIYITLFQTDSRPLFLSFMRKHCIYILHEKLVLFRKLFHLYEVA